jgi:DNA-binding NarL/FixJ family response regulator
MSNGLRVVIGEPDGPTRAAVRQALEHDGCEVLAEAGSAAAAVRATLALRPDVTLLELVLPGGGIPAVRQITRESDCTTVVVLTASASGEHVAAALRAGACGYLLKEMDPTGLATRLRRIVAGEVILPRALRREVAERLASRA